MLGQVVATPGAVAALDPTDILEALARHMHGDWGNLDPHDQQANQDAVRSGARILSAYRSGANVTFWIITEADRSVTTVLLPEEY